MNRQIIIFNLLFFSILAAFSQPTLPIKNRTFSLPQDADIMPGKVIVKLAEEYRNQLTPNRILIPEIQARLSLLKTNGVKKVFPNSVPPANAFDNFGNELVDLSLIYEVDFQQVFSVEDAVNLLASHPAVVYAEPHYIYQTFYLPNDPIADTTGGIPGMWHLSQISALEAWDIQRGDPNIIIAVVDAGTNFKHDDLKNNLAKNFDDPIDGIDNDGDGYIDNFRGWDFGGDYFGGPPDNNPSIGNVHGLWVAGTACAEADNSLGVAGVSFNCRYLPIKASSDDSLNSISFGYQGIVYAADYGAQIINASWGSNVKTFFGQDVVRYATFNRSAVVICAAGNSGSDQVFYPAGFRESISVANSSYGDTVCCGFSSATGNSTFNHTVDVSAPGWRVASVRGDDNYWGWSGTSAAAPVMAGAVGIVKAYFPEITGFQAAQRLRVTSDDVYQTNPNYLEKLGFGRINLAKALSNQTSPSIRVINFSTEDLDGDGIFLGGDTLVIKVDFFNYLDPTQDLAIDISSNYPFIEIIDEDFQAGAIGKERSFSSEQEFKIKLWEQIPPNAAIELRIGYEDDLISYSDYEYINLRVNKTWLEITENRLYTSLNSLGNFGFDDFGMNQDGIGVVYSLEPNSLFEGGFLVGNSEARISDRIRRVNGGRDEDFSIVEIVNHLADDRRADFVARAIFDDSNAPQPLGLQVTNHAYAFRSEPNRNFVILEYIIENQSNQVLDSLFSGLFADWDISVFADPVTFFPTTKNASDYDTKHRLVYAYDQTGLSSVYQGLSLISDKDFYAFATTNPNANFGFDNPGKYSALKNVPTPQTATAGMNDGGTDIMHFISGGPFFLGPNEKDTLAFAVLGSNSLVDLQTSTDDALKVYNCVVLGKGPVVDFSVSDSMAGPGMAIQFGDNNPNAISWQWSFGDGTQSSSSSPQHAYASTGFYQVSLNVFDGECEFTSSQWVRVVDNTNIEDALHQAGVSVYPNPGNGLMTLEIDNKSVGEWKLDLLDLNGRKVWQESIKKGNGPTLKTLNFSRFSKGIYLLEITNKDFRGYEKVIIR